MIAAAQIFLLLISATPFLDGLRNHHLFRSIISVDYLSPGRISSLASRDCRYPVTGTDISKNNLCGLYSTRQDLSDGISHRNGLNLRGAGQRGGAEDSRERMLRDGMKGGEMGREEVRGHEM